MHLLCKQFIVGSSPITSTMNRRKFIGNVIAATILPKIPMPIVEKLVQIEPVIESYSKIETVELSIVDALTKAMIEEIQKEIDIQIIETINSQIKHGIGIEVVH